MTRTLLIMIIAVLVVGSMAVGQDYPRVSIRDIQEVTDSLLLQGKTDSPLVNDTVWVYGIVATAPRMDNGLPLWYTGDRWRFILTDPSDTIFNSITAVAVDTAYFRDNVGMDQVGVGDSVEILGKVTEYRGLTQFEPLRVDTSLKLLGVSSFQPTPVLRPLTDFFVGSVKQEKPGEYYESALVRLENLTVIGTAGFEFTVADEFNNQIIVDDQSNAVYGNPPPSAGAKIGFVQGIIFTNSAVNWTINPRTLADYRVLGFAPTITDLGRLDSLPGPSTAVTVRANIVDNDGLVTSASVFYSKNGVPQGSISMTSGADSVWSAVIPAAGGDSTFVSYYFRAVDDSGVVAYAPSDTVNNRLFYLSLNRLPGIRDIQYNPYGGGSSYFGTRLTVRGIATSDRRDFGAIYIQDGTGPWSGIRIQSPGDSSIRRGDDLTVTGFIRDAFGHTLVDTATFVLNSSGNPLPAPSLVTADEVRTGGPLGEAYESVLLELRDVFVVNLNEDAISNSNFGEYGVHENKTRTTGLRVNDFSVKLPFTNDTSRAADKEKTQLHVGDSFESIRGILAFDFSHFKLSPRDSADFTGHTDITGVERIDAAMPERFVLAQNYPNPFNPATTIRYALPAGAHVTLKVFNVLGQEMATIVDQLQEAGSYSVTLGADLFRARSSGVYFYRLEAGEFVAVKKMLLVK